MGFRSTVGGVYARRAWEMCGRDVFLPVKTLAEVPRARHRSVGSSTIRSELSSLASLFSLGRARLVVKVGNGRYRVDDAAALFSRLARRFETDDPVHLGFLASCVRTLSAIAKKCPGEDLCIGLEYLRFFREAADGKNFGADGRSGKRPGMIRPGDATR
jgi:hypothetical protein